MGVKNASSCMKMAALLIAITCVLLGITPANSQEKTYDYGMDPTIVKNPADNDLPRAQGPFHKIPKLGSLLTRGGSSDNTTFELYSSQEPQETNLMFPAGRSHLPTASIDMNPEVLARLREWAKVDGTKIRQINAYSPSMGRTIPLVWIPAKDTSQPRPVLYALGGGDGGQGEKQLDHPAPTWWTTCGSAMSTSLCPCLVRTACTPTGKQNCPPRAETNVGDLSHP